MADGCTVGSRRNGGEGWTLPSGASANIRGLTVREMDKLANRRKLKAGVAFDEILAACIDPFDPLKAYMGDRMFGLLAVRIETHGPDYAFRTKCPDCAQALNKAVDLETLSVRVLGEDRGPFELTLPGAQKVVSWRLLTGADEKRMSEEFEEEAREHALSLALALRIVAIEGEQMVSRKFVESMQGRDAAAIWQDINTRDCGVDTAVMVECPNCMSDFEVNMPLDPTFLLPTKGRG